MTWKLPRIKAELKMALGCVYSIRMHTSHDRWTPEQVELIARIERDLVALRNTL